MHGRQPQLTSLLAFGTDACELKRPPMKVVFRTYSDLKDDAVGVDVRSRLLEHLPVRRHHLLVDTVPILNPEVDRKVF